MNEKDIEHRLTEVEGRSKSNAHRLEDLERRQDNLDDLVSTVKVLADREARVEDDVSEIKNDVKEMKDKPGKKWESFVEKVALTIVGLVLGYLATKIGLG